MNNSAQNLGFKICEISDKARQNDGTIIFEID